jgi:uncharacterized membrane protein YfcA
VNMGAEEITGLVLFGLFVGAVGTLIGAGGGFLMMPAFLFFYRDKGPGVLTAISLAVVCANASSGSIAYAKMKRISYRAGLMFALATIPGAAAGAVIVDYISTKTFELIFGSVIIIAGSYLFFSVRKRLDSMQADAKTIPLFNMRLGIVINVFVGFLSSILGIGGGIVHVPMMVYLLDFPVHFATATSHFVLAIMTAVGTIVHIYRGDLAGQWSIILSLSAGVIAGAQIGAFISQKFKSVWIIRLLAVALAIVGLRVLYQGL